MQELLFDSASGVAELVQIRSRADDRSLRGPKPPQPHIRPSVAETEQFRADRLRLSGRIEGPVAS